jgi:hypothetical protein
MSKRFRIENWKLRNDSLANASNERPGRNRSLMTQFQILNCPSAMNDLRFAFRQLLKNPGFTAVPCSRSRGSSQMSDTP